MNLWTNKQQLPFEGSWGWFWWLLPGYHGTPWRAQVYTHKYTDVLCMYISIKVWHDTLRLQPSCCWYIWGYYICICKSTFAGCNMYTSCFFRPLSVDSSSPVCAPRRRFCPKKTTKASGHLMIHSAHKHRMLRSSPQKTQFMSKHVVMGALCYDCWMVPVEIWWRSRNVQLFSRFYISQLV